MYVRNRDAKATIQENTQTKLNKKTRIHSTTATGASLGNVDGIFINTNYNSKLKSVFCDINNVRLKCENFTEKRNSQKPFVDQGNMEHEKIENEKRVKGHTQKIQKIQHKQAIAIVPSWVKKRMSKRLRHDFPPSLNQFLSHLEKCCGYVNQLSNDIKNSSATRLSGSIETVLRLFVSGGRPVAPARPMLCLELGRVAERRERGGERRHQPTFGG